MDDEPPTTTTSHLREEGDDISSETFSPQMFMSPDETVPRPTFPPDDSALDNPDNTSAAQTTTPIDNHPTSHPITDPPTLPAPPKDTPTHTHLDAPLTRAALAAAPPGYQKGMLGNKLYRIVHRLHPESANKIINHLLYLDNAELLDLMETDKPLEELLRM
eukprot:4154270-Heterocapsa_arctica.AAC.1